MRVTAGKYKNRRLKCPPGSIRPAMERMRISLFSILGDLDSVSFLDMFSGSGIMCAEAASRGACRVVAVEKDPRKKEVLRSNLFFVEEEKRVVVMDALVYLERFKGRETFDVIYLDPPFAYPDKVKLLNKAFDNGFMNSNSIMLIHYPKDDEKRFSELTGSLTVTDERAYGRSRLKFLELA